MHNDNRIKKLLYSLAKLMPDRLFVSLKYRKAFGKSPDLKNPKTFNEKLCWLKLHDHNPLYTQMVDKYEAKKYAESIIGSKHIIPTYGVWDRAEDIDFDSLPDKFVMKATHDSGRVIICHDKSKLDLAWAREEMRKSLKRDFYAMTREWPYKNVKPRIIAEKLLELPDCDDLKDINDYKFFAFNGKVKFFKIDFDRSTNHRANYYDPDFNPLDFGEEMYLPDPDKIISKPAGLETMIALTEKIAGDKKFVRVDFYDVGGEVYFGEITFYPQSGTGRFVPNDADERIGGLLQL